jgi:aryl-alcohol dehydrogenase-like predicted oxidoreductase
MPPTTPSLIPTLQLGKDGPLVPALGFGMLPLCTPAYGPMVPEEDRLAMLDRLYEMGCTFWDASEYVSPSSLPIPVLSNSKKALTRRS